MITRFLDWEIKGIRVAPIIAYLLLAGVTLIAFSRTASIDELDRRARSSCERLNIVRAQSNVSDAVSFSILASSSQRERALVKEDPENASIHRASARILSKQAGRLTVTALTNCEAARNPKYKYPLAGPVGNPRNGDLNPKADKIIEDSEQLLRNTGMIKQRQAS